MAYIVTHIPRHARGKFLPRGKAKSRLRTSETLATLANAKKNGVIFSPDHARPEWVWETNKRRGENIPKFNFRGFKVRASDKLPEPGFPTHWH